MAAMRAPVLAAIIPIRTGKGRQTADVEAAMNARDDLAVHHSEALAFVDTIRPLVDRLEMVALETGPRAQQTVLTLAALIDRYERRHISDPETAA